MQVRDLFKSGLTVPEHEIRDLHYIGEALPVPSQITTSISVEADANAGSSPVPAREDHQHAVDVQSLITFINENEEEIDLTNYYTKAEVDDLIADVIAGTIDLTNYYDKDEIDDFLDIIIGEFDNYYTKAEIDAIILGLYDADFFTFEKEWSYGTVVNNSSLVTLGRYDAFRNFSITQIAVTLVLASAEDHILKLYQDVGSTGSYSLIDTTTITAGDLVEIFTPGSPLDIDFDDRLLVTLDSEPDGDGEILVYALRGFYRE